MWYSKRSEIGLLAFTLLVIELGVFTYSTWYFVIAVRGVPESALQGWCYYDGTLARTLNIVASGMLMNVLVLVWGLRRVGPIMSPTIPKEIPALSAVYCLRVTLIALTVLVNDLTKWSLSMLPGVEL